MNPLGKNQDTVFEALEKGNFIAPPGGDERDTQDVPQLRRAMEWLAPGLVLGAMVPYMGNNFELLAFLGGIVTLFGCARLVEENRWCKAAMWAAVAQVLGRCLRLFAQTLLPMLLELAVYPICLYAAVMGAALVPVILTIALLKIRRKAALLMGVAAVTAVVLPVLWLLGVMPLIRVAVAALGTVAAVWLLVWTK